MKASWTEGAELELYEIGDYIAADNVEAAVAWIERLRARADAVARMPRSGRVVPELDVEDLREVFVGTYRLIYRVIPGGIEVMSVFEGSKQLRVDDER
ncbi:MAG: type II toxin-antitoxin system RelE/ParE family toxin [Myxococcales bacterium]|nr:type II toxin-antitoxin system RelE/ParE family toxin [Myxococcales bacterium]